jgi:hypothetical protein
MGSDAPPAQQRQQAALCPRPSEQRGRPAVAAARRCTDRRSPAIPWPRPCTGGGQRPLRHRGRRSRAAHRSLEGPVRRPPRSWHTEALRRGGQAPAHKLAVAGWPISLQAGRMKQERSAVSQRRALTLALEGPQVGVVAEVGAKRVRVQPLGEGAAICGRKARGVHTT